MTTHADISNLASRDRRRVLEGFVNDVFIPQRRRLLAYHRYTNQSAQVDSDGYMAQIVASIVLGVPGNTRRGKSGNHPGDLSDGTEVKSAYRAEQLNRMEDSHINFGQIVPANLRKFFERELAIIVHTSYDVRGKVKIEVLRLALQDPTVQQAVEDFLARSSAARPQLQPRLYPDGRRDRLQDRPGHFLDLGAELLARVVVLGGEAVVDKWQPTAGLPLTECLDEVPGDPASEPAHVIHDPADPDEFFYECMVSHRQALIDYCFLTASSQNVGFGNLAQHLVSIVTGTPGTGSGARGYDLEDTSEIKLAMGLRGDPLGTEDFPRLNLGSNVDKMLSWRTLYPVRILCVESGLKVKVFEADSDEFRNQVLDYFGPGSLFENSPNLQYHAPKTFEDHVWTGRRSDGSPRLLQTALLYEADEADFTN